MYKSRAIALAFGASLVLGTSAAQADSPASVAGTWSAVANQTTGALVISQSAAGTCKAIRGTIFGSPMQGYYCPSTGRIVFARFSGSTPFQAYQAVVGTDAATDRMGGTFLAWNSLGGGAPPEFNFNAVK